MCKKEIIRRVFSEIVDNPILDESLVRHLFAADYEQHVDGNTLNLSQFIDHMHLQKAHIHNVQTEFLALVEEGDLVFSNHIVRAEKADGSHIAAKVLAQFLFAPDGKIAACDELTRLLSGSAEDADLGSRH